MFFFDRPSPGEAHEIVPRKRFFRNFMVGDFLRTGPKTDVNLLFHRTLSKNSNIHRFFVCPAFDFIQKSPFKVITWRGENFATRQTENPVNEVVVIISGECS